MVTLTKIYTRGGDAGETSLGDGSRRVKDDIRVAAYGSVDEANACIGLARLHTTADTDETLARIQNDLFDLGADLCTPEGKERRREALRVSQEQVERLEREIDAYNEPLQPLKSFVLPGGSAASAYLHLARTVTRRAEREVVELARAEPVGEPVVKYLNRLSDLLFVLSRHCNDAGNGDVLWAPGANR